MVYAMMHKNLYGFVALNKNLTDKIGDITYILVFKTGRNKDQRPSCVPTNTMTQCQLSRLVLAWFRIKENAQSIID